MKERSGNETKKKTWIVPSHFVLLAKIAHRISPLLSRARPRFHPSLSHERWTGTQTRR